jgi:hypothetical protein
VTLPRLRSSLWPLVLIVAVVVLVAACAGPSGSPGASGAAVTPVPQAAIPLKPVTPTEPQIEVRRAEPVRPMENQAVVDSTIKLDRPPPVDF